VSANGFVTVPAGRGHVSFQPSRDKGVGAGRRAACQCETRRRRLTEITEWSFGFHTGPAALDRLTPIIYDDLLRLAKARLKVEFRGCPLQPTALVHESYLRLADQTKLACESRAHFYAVAANVMRRVLIDYARKRNARKRGAGIRVTLQTGMDFSEDRAPPKAGGVR
jgi:RNA polymerase sigma factor (TIGR02999 family)